jgi:hypothetical protein
LKPLFSQATSTNSEMLQVTGMGLLASMLAYFFLRYVPAEREERKTAAAMATEAVAKAAVAAAEAVAKAAAANNAVIKSIVADHAATIAHMLRNCGQRPDPQAGRREDA